MGVIPTIAPFLLPTMLPRLREQWPELKLYLREETSSAACDALHRGQLDCVLLALPFACGEVDNTPLFDDPLFVAYPRGRSAATMLSVLASEIDEKRLLLLEDGHCLKDHALSACNRPELRAHAAMMGTSLHTLVQMVDNGLGLTFVPGMAIEAGILGGTSVDARPLRSEYPVPSHLADLAPLEPTRSRIPAARDHPPAHRRRPDPGPDRLRARSAARSSQPAADPGASRYFASSGSAIPIGSLLFFFCARSKRSAFITLVQALTKSCTNFSSLPFSA